MEKPIYTYEKEILINNPILGTGQYPISITASHIRQFNGTIGLLYNNENYYDNGGEKQLSWTFNDVKELIRKYIRQMNIDKKMDLCIGLSNIETQCYTCKDYYIEEPIIRVYGEIDRCHKDIPDEEILNILVELFTYLKVELRQNSVKLNYQGFREHKSYLICYKDLKENEYICSLCEKVVINNELSLSIYHNEKWICLDCYIDKSK